MYYAGEVETDSPNMSRFSRLRPWNSLSANGRGNNPTRSRSLAKRLRQKTAGRPELN